ncbi:MAG: hypothetical protein E6356_17775 [Terrisporobacter othiniensis]|nr:hypothetical protein [Terrisporobacter othiniensis]MDU6996703.1 hypothetical protein [Terrisporobacter othiniensis]
MELEYIEDIKDDIINMITNDLKRRDAFESCVSRVVFENDYYMSDEMPIERDCHYIAIGAYAVESNNTKNLPDEVSITGLLDSNSKNLLDEIKRSIGVIKSGAYDDSLTEEDKKYIFEDIKLIESSELLK